MSFLLFPSLSCQMSLRPKCAGVILLTGLVALGACRSSEPKPAADTAAGKLGQAAHKAVVEANKDAKAVGREINKAAREAHAGWNEEARKEAARKEAARKDAAAKDQAQK
jgi:hypothetical protein